MTKLTLPTILLADALSCGAIFALGVFATRPVAGLLGLPELVVAAGGWICLAAGMLLAFLAIRPVKLLLALAIAGNAAWVLASVAVSLVSLVLFGVLLAVGDPASGRRGGGLHRAGGAGDARRRQPRGA